MEWKDVMIPALQTTSLVLLCLVWFMIGKYRALCRRQKAEVANVLTMGQKSEGAWIGLTESVGGVSREVQLNFDASMDKNEVMDRMEAVCWEFMRPLNLEGVEVKGEIHLN